MKNQLPLALCIFFAFSIPRLPGQEGVLDSYIREGLESNLALKQKNADYRKSLQALDHARGYYLPAIRFQARYTLAGGGRVIEFPAGDLLNPVYNTLNLLTGTQDFLPVSDEEFRFYRPREQETKIELTQPLFHPEIAYRYRITKSVAGLSRAGVESVRRQLVCDIKTAYYGYRKALGMENLVAEQRILLEENLRVNRKLYENQMINIDAVYRSEAELAGLEQVEAGVEKQMNTAASYFNFLLNREHSSVILVDTLPYCLPVPALSEATVQALSGREEIEMIDRSLEASSLALRLNQGNALPRLYAVVDYGFQGEDYRLTADDDFILASLVLSWDLFRGRQNRSLVSQAMIEQEKWESRREEMERQITLEAEQSWYDLQASRKQLAAARKQLNSSGEAFRNVDRRYREGNASLLEWLDARNQLSVSGENALQAEFDLAISYAVHERITATYQLPELTIQKP